MEEIAANDSKEANPITDEVSSPSPLKTPMYQAINAPRYERQNLIKQVGNLTCRVLLCYVSGGSSGIDRDDPLYITDLLHNVEHGKNVDLLLHTPGGDIDATEKLCGMIRDHVDKGTLRVIVPDYAKSAGTLVAIGADSIVMSDTSELGPIDPQIGRRDGNGNTIWQSIMCYLDSYDTLVEDIKKDPANVVAQIMINKFDPPTVTHYLQVRDRARVFAEKQLKFGMFRDGIGNFTQITTSLMDTKQWLTHGQMIGWQDAKKIGLNVEYVKFSEQIWQLYWQIYCLQRLAIRDREKLFESDYVSLSVIGRD